MEPWKKAVVLAAGTAGVAAVLYYLLREEPETKVTLEGSSNNKKARKLRVDEISIEQVQQILSEIVDSQEKMRTHMKDLTRELLAKQLNFEQTYIRVREVQPEDPLERYGLGMAEFDMLLSKYQHDPKVKEGIARIMGVPTTTSTKSPTEKASPPVPARTVIDVHTFMLEELEKLVKYFSTIKNKESYDMKTVTLAAQAVVGAKVEEKFGLTSEDIERGVIQHHSTLATDQEFAIVNVKMQQAMALLMGADMSG